MSEPAIWGIILGGMMVTYLTRLSFVLLIPQRWLFPAFKRGLRFVPAAVLTAIILPELVLPAGYLDLSLHNHRLLAGISAALAGLFFRNTWVTIATGLAALWLLAGR